MTDLSQEGSLGKFYTQSKPFLESALTSYEAKLQGGLQGLLSDFYITGRVKASRSLIRKIRNGRGAPRTWESIQDKVGLRVICSTKADVKSADKWIQSHHWTVIERTVKKARHDKLFYPGLHFIIQDTELVDHNCDPVLCEVQIRTRAQDAWSVVSHKLLYKGLINPPKRIQRVITRLTVVVEMFDDEVQRMINKRRRLPAYRPAMMLEYLDEKYESITGEPSGIVPDVDLMLILANAYTAEEQADFESLIDTFCVNQAELLDGLLRKYQPESEAYLDSRDWLYSQPEVLSILERAVSKKYLLLAAVTSTDLEDIVRKTCITAHLPLPAPA